MHARSRSGAGISTPEFQFEAQVPPRRSGGFSPLPGTHGRKCPQTRFIALPCVSRANLCHPQLIQAGCTRHAPHPRIGNITHGHAAEHCAQMQARAMRRVEGFLATD
ncbi:MAG: hypothetical protein C0518_08460 [Opitutus sp.]|nr:hypothetical protein [Opitutus sp.]